MGRGVYLDFADAISTHGREVISARYGNLFDMYQKITGEDPYVVPMRIYPASHYTMGGLWVDYHLMSTIEGLHVIGEANFSDHGANRLGASALMQGLADGYFVLPDTMGHYLGSRQLNPVDTDHPEFVRAEEDVSAGIARLIALEGTRSVDSFHRELGQIMWNYCGMARNTEGLKRALQEIPELRERFWSEARVAGGPEELNMALERAGRVADFLELAEVLCHDALSREESCGAHFREEHQTAEGEARRDDENYAFVSAWEFNGVGEPPVLHKERLVFEAVDLTTRSYK